MKRMPNILVMSSFPYSTALITGGSSGIGLAIARDLSALGVTTLLVARGSDRLAEAQEDVGRRGGKCLTLPVDITSEADLDHLRKFLTHQALTPDLLVNNAGFGYYGAFDRGDMTTQLAMIDLNVRALVRLTYEFLPEMLRANHGAIINVSSTASFQPVPFMATYGATKAFVTSFSMALASELRHSGVRVLASCPGRTHTNFQLIAGSDKVRIRSHVASADDVARVTIDALTNRRLFVIEGVRNKMMVHLQRLFPRSVVLRIADSIFRPREP